MLAGKKGRKNPVGSNLYVYSSSSACSRRPCLELRYSLLWYILVSESSEGDAEGVWGCVSRQQTEKGSHVWC
jgi:hypothetical protein